MTLPDPARSRVVLIGASRFTDPELPDLPAVRNNLDGLAACLGDMGRCTVVADPESPIALVDPIHDAAADAEDTLLIYYAGHGLVHPRTLGLLLAVVSSAPGRTHTSVPYDLVRENVIDSPARRKVVILDCCYSGRAVGGMADPTTALVNEATVEGTYLLASAPPNKQALSPPGERFTAFTGALLTLFNEGVPDGPALLRLDLIYRHIREALRRAARPEPQLRADNTAGELALVRNLAHRQLFHPSPAVPKVSLPAGDIVPETGDPPRRKQIRDRLKALVRQTGFDKSYACPVCQTTVTGQHLIRHYDKHTRREALSIDPAMLTLEPLPVLLDNRYLLGENISEMVRLATDTLTQQTVVVKQTRAHRAVRLDHPAIVRVLDVMTSHVVLEYVDGRTTEEVLRSEGPMAPLRAAEIMSEVCAALDHAHLDGVVHGDINSRNVMLTREGAVKILNFGAGNGADARQDLYLAGRLLFELLTGRKPEFGSPVLPGVSPALVKIVQTALHPDQAERYQTARAMQYHLMQALKQ